MKKIEDKNNRIWYSKSLLILQPLRFHLKELIDEMESYNRYAKRIKGPSLSIHKINDAKLVLNEAEKFFTGK